MTELGAGEDPTDPAQSVRRPLEVADASAWAITRSTWELLDDHFVTEPIGLVDVKAKGKIATWRVVGPRRR